MPTVICPTDDDRKKYEDRPGWHLDYLIADDTGRSFQAVFSESDDDSGKTFTADLDQFIQFTVKKMKALARKPVLTEDEKSLAFECLAFSLCLKDAPVWRPA